MDRQRFFHSWKRPLVRQLNVVTLTLALSWMMAACTAVGTPLPAGESSPATPTTAAASEATEVPVSESVTDSESVTETATSPIMESEASSGCPMPTDDTTLVSSTVAGYCFLMPSTFERSPTSDAEGFHLGIFGPATTPGHRERAFIDVTEATSQTIEEMSSAIVDDALAIGVPITPTGKAILLGGLPAIELLGVPGQDLSIKTIAQANGNSYVLTFVPYSGDHSDDRPDARAEMDALHEMMVETFQFITPTTTASSYAPMLTWEGEIDGACSTMTIFPSVSAIGAETEGSYESSGLVSVGLCGDAPSVTSTMAADNAEWLAIQEHFGDINGETPAGKVIFQGKGSASGDVWTQALATWARFTAMEVNAGRTGAAARTALAWQLTDTPEHSGFCSQLVVLAYGYAYANQIPCTGSGQSTPVAMGWLSDSELDTFYDWLSNGARVEDKAGYLDATGSTPITPEEISAWANAIYLRMLQ